MGEERSITGFSSALDMDQVSNPKHKEIFLNALSLSSRLLCCVAELFRFHMVRLKVTSCLKTEL